MVMRYGIAGQSEEMSPVNLDECRPIHVDMRRRLRTESGFLRHGYLPKKGRTPSLLLSVGVFDAADVTFLTAIVLEHEDS